MDHRSGEQLAKIQGHGNCKPMGLVFILHVPDLKVLIRIYGRIHKEIV